MEKNTKQDEKRTSMNIALSVENKKFLKMYALEHNTNVAALINEYVEKLRKETSK